MKRSIMLCIFLCIFVFSIYPAAYSAVEFKVNVNFYYGAVGDTKPEGAVGVYPLNWQSNALGTLWEREEGELGWTESDRPWRMTLNLTIDGSFFALVLPSGEDETDISGNLDGLTFYNRFGDLFLKWMFTPILVLLFAGVFIFKD